MGLWKNCSKVRGPPESLGLIPLGLHPGIFFLLGNALLLVSGFLESHSEGKPH